MNRLLATVLDNIEFFTSLLLVFVISRPHFAEMVWRALPRPKDWSLWNSSYIAGQQMPGILR